MEKVGNSFDKKECFKNTFSLSEVYGNEKIENGNTIKYLNRDGKVAIVEEYLDESRKEILSRTYYDKNDPSLPKYKEVFAKKVYNVLDDKIEASLDNELGYELANKLFIFDKDGSLVKTGVRFYGSKDDFYNDNYFTIFTNKEEQKYEILDTCGGKTSINDCEDVFMESISNDLKKRENFEILGNSVSFTTFIKIMQEKYKDNNVFHLYDSNYNDFESIKNKGQIDLEKIKKDLPQDKISIIPITLYGHATVLLFTPDNKPDNKQFHLFDSSGLLSNSTENLKKVFGKNYENDIDRKSMEMHGMQENGSCTFWSSMFIKEILEKSQNYEYNKDYFQQNIVDKFNNLSIPLNLCCRMSKVFDDKTKGGESIKMVDMKKDEEEGEELEKNGFKKIYTIDNNSYYVNRRKMINNRFVSGNILDDMFKENNTLKEDNILKSLIKKFNRAVNDGFSHINHYLYDSHIKINDIDNLLKINDYNDKIINQSLIKSGINKNKIKNLKRRFNSYKRRLKLINKCDGIFKNILLLDGFENRTSILMKEIQAYYSVLLNSYKNTLKEQIKETKEKNKEGLNSKNIEDAKKRLEVLEKQVDNIEMVADKNVENSIKREQEIIKKEREIKKNEVVKEIRELNPLLKTGKTVIRREIVENNNINNNDIENKERLIKNLDDCFNDLDKITTKINIQQRS